MVEWNSFAGVRRMFTELGINVVVWDKPGCGASEGEFDINQPVASSADEVVTAVHALRAQGIEGSQRMGLWGSSRAGWIAPAGDPGGAIPSASGSPSAASTTRRTPATCSRGTLPIEGPLRRGDGTLGERMAAEHRHRSARRQLRGVRRSGCRDERGSVLPVHGVGGASTEESFRTLQAQFESGVYNYDPVSRLAVYVPEFPELLSSLDIPVLALFGELDTNVDWRQTAALYG